MPYVPVRDEALKQIVKLRLNRVKSRLEVNHKMQLTWDDTVADEIARRCREVDSGARNVDSIISNNLLPRISHLLLELMAKREKKASMHVSLAANGSFLLA